MAGSGDTRSVAVCKRGEIADGRIKVFKVDGAEGIVIRVGDTYRACQRFCTHEKFPLEFGRLSDPTTLRCTYHGAEFDLVTGAVKAPPAFKGIAVYPVRIEGDDVVVDIPA
jgi:nitrite reductase/ring-hydroxylating ferredoxin subunit